MKVKPGQIWWKNYAPDYHCLLVRVEIVEVNKEYILSRVIESSIENRPVGMELKAHLNGMDPLKYKLAFGWYLESELSSSEIYGDLRELN